MMDREKLYFGVFGDLHRQHAVEHNQEGVVTVHRFTADLLGFHGAQRRQLVASFTRGEQYGRILFWEERCQGQLTNPCEQADGEDFLTGDLCEVGEFLAGDAGSQRVPPEVFVIKRAAQALLVAVHDRQADYQIADTEGAQRDDGTLQRDDGARAAKGRGVGEEEDAPGDGRIGLHQLDQIGRPEVVALQQANDRQGDALGRGQLAGCFQRRVTIRIDITHGCQSGMGAFIIVQPKWEREAPLLFCHEPPRTTRCDCANSAENEMTNFPGDHCLLEPVDAGTAAADQSGPAGCEYRSGTIDHDKRRRVTA